MSRARVHCDEAGFSLVVAVVSLMLMLLIGAVALKQVVGAHVQARENSASKRALQAADAGIQTAIFRAERADLTNSVNIDPLNPTAALQQNCVIALGTVAGGVDLQTLDPLTPTDPNGLKWCPATTAEASDSGGSFSYRMSQVLRVNSGPCGSTNVLSLDRDVVSTGTAGGITRRVHARMSANLSLLSGAAVQASSTSSPLTMRDTARVLGTVQSNSSITGVTTNVISGNAVALAPGTVSGPAVAGNSTTRACEPLVLPAVDQGSARTTNNNTGYAKTCTDSTGLLLAPTCKSLLGATLGDVVYDATTRSLSVTGTAIAMLTGSSYSLCSIRLSGSGMLLVKSTTPLTRIFIDDPDGCKSSSGVPYTNAGQITMDGQARIVNCHAQTQPDTLQIYALGNTSTATTQTLAGGGLLSSTVRTLVCGANIPLVGDPMVFYAPNSTIELGGSTAIAGQVAGNVVHMSGAAAVQPVNALINLDQLGANPVLPLYRPTDYVECTGKPFSRLPVNDPSQGC